MIRLNRLATSSSLLRFTVNRTTSTSRSMSDRVVRIGDVSVTTKPAKRPELVPVGYLPSAPLTSSTRGHLRWLMQKDAMKQDVFLIGAPGHTRRRLALMYLQLTNKEVEYIALSRDTTESDLKQRREIHANSAIYVDQAVVNAAVHGRVLILDGIEKAERNVLPILNNLLENNEMQLDDGRYMMSAARYDQLLQTHSAEELAKFNLIRVHEDFRIIALGLPVPRYKGNALDPPLRSRFQALHVDINHYQDNLQYFTEMAPNADKQSIQRMVSMAMTINSQDFTTLTLPDFPIENLRHAAHILNVTKNIPPSRIINYLYPYELMLSSDGQNSVKGVLETFNLQAKSSSTLKPTEVDASDGGANVTFSTGDKISVNVGNRKIVVDKEYVSSSHHDSVLSDMILAHSVSDMCLIGLSGSGKTALVNEFARLFDYHVETILLYKDMSVKELIQTRGTCPTSGDSTWRFSSLVQAALDGDLAVLDGIHRLTGATFSALHRLIQDRDLSLFDGRRLLRHDRYDEIMQQEDLTTEQMTSRGILRVSPKFRVIAMAEPSTPSEMQWLNSELLTMFLFHYLRPLDLAEEMHVITTKVKGEFNIDSIMNLTHKLRNSHDANIRSLASSLSTRQLLRIAKRLSMFPTTCSEFEIINKACLSRFLPRLTASALEQEMKLCNITPDDVNPSLLEDTPFKCETKKGILRIGETRAKIYDADSQLKVPNVLFYENRQHMKIMEEMLQDFLLGEHLLLVGNQGVGKNKIVDHFLSLLNRPREYLQLHRDTTVQSLTSQTTVLDGRIVHEDSPLVSAARYGRVLIVDEADKAPTDVTCILRTLVEGGEMHLSDGRTIVKGGVQSPLCIPLHKDFRMIVLANRPGFPFLGNDFFAAMGDIFSTHVINNPDPQSEMQMIKQYAPEVDEAVLKQLIAAFGDLRDMADKGIISYPYSTRELISVVKHLQAFPSEGVTSVLRNVFDFDTYDADLKKSIFDAMHRHGIPLGANSRNVQLPEQHPLPDFTKISKISKKQEITDFDVKVTNINVKPCKDTRIDVLPLESVNRRSSQFSMLLKSFHFPMRYRNERILNLCTTTSTDEPCVHVLMGPPLTLMSATGGHLRVHDLYESLPRPMSTSRTQHLSLGELDAEQVLLHDGLSNTFLAINWRSGQTFQLTTGSLVNRTTKSLLTSFSSKSPKPSTMITNDDGVILCYKQDSPEVELLFVDRKLSVHLTTPFHISTVHNLLRNQWMLTDLNATEYLLTKDLEDNFSIHQVHADISHDFTGSSFLKPNESLLSGPDSYAIIAEHGENSISLKSAQRKDIVHLKDMKTVHIGQQIIRSLPHHHQQPKQGNDQTDNVSSVLEITDMRNSTFSYVPVEKTQRHQSDDLLLCRASMTSGASDGRSNTCLVSVDQLTGECHQWQTNDLHLSASLDSWQRLIGHSDLDPQLTIEKQGLPPTPSGPKHGKVDADNTPHTGGNQWAGGTGGSDTAGLGGVGGPYRLDAGHTVTQVSDEVKAAVPDHVKKAAREMNRKAFEQRLTDINMSKFSSEIYEQFSVNVKSEIVALRSMLQSLQAQSEERKWLRNQVSGDLDESKLVESLAGEKTVFRKRGVQPPEVGAPQLKPKTLRLVCDVSGSMYRFNGHDRRLTRQMEAMLMVMEAFQGFEQKINYSIVGHSGEGFNFEFVKADSPPKNKKEILTVLEMLEAHAQFCLSGDHTLEAARFSISEISKVEEVDERFVVILSDANFSRYGISPTQFAEQLTAKANVNAFVVFIGSLGDQAESLQKKMPIGHSFICMETKNLPKILQQIFVSAMLK